MQSNNLDRELMPTVFKIPQRVSEYLYLHILQLHLDCRRLQLGLSACLDRAF